MSARNNDLATRLAAHPQLQARVEAVLAIVEDTAGELTRADAAEQRVIEALRQMGNEALHAWAVAQEQRQVEAVRTPAAALTGHGQKNSAGTPRSAR
jgi:hypothetical protein